MTELLERPIERRTHFDIGAIGWREQLLRPRRIARGKHTLVRVPARPLPVWAESESDPDAARRCARALDDMLANRGQPAAEIDRIIDDHPESIFAHSLR